MLHRVKIVEVGPRDGLQNEKALLSTELKVELIERLVGAGLRDVEAGSFVSPKWVPQMASTPDVLTSPTLSRLRSLHSSLSLPVLVPNARGLSSLLSLLDAHPSDPPLTNELAVFVSATEGFSRANLNTSVSSSLDALPPLIEQAQARGLRVRAYVSVVLGCPFEGRVEPEQPAAVAKRLLDMGAYEVSLGDTIGVGVPGAWERLVNECERQGVPVSKLAAHCHDTYGTAVSSVLHCVSTLGIRTIDSSIAALGGCPYSPGATGNVATEDVVYALAHEGWATSALPDPDEARGERWDGLLGWDSTSGEQGVRETRFKELCRVGEWVSERLGRENGSRVGRAMKGRRERRERDERKRADREGAKAKL
ncbi:hypothetical protein Rhopal_000603-T1 [Rhodotorula paludigena]|uniref:hydroxymethylglutaryl-CoA lyase n=1 Tax=Rhodotorula paludigena TaxID=86838 RepID=A0AAV5GBH4_9BASI|nr:hypothetical protein Rhopal_000603-T1 [Rhodotorula paludigena]